MDISNMTAAARESGPGLAAPAAQAWAHLCSQIRDFQPDVVVLVARKMPRLFEAMKLNLGESAICVSDQAIPFIKRDIARARVAIVDDVWNVGTTMRRAEQLVKRSGAQTIRMFALGARNAPSAVDAGVRLACADSLTEYQYVTLVGSVPKLLRSVAKPYDADFPIIPCVLKAPYSNWNQCSAWLKATFGDFTHETIDEEQFERGLVRAAVNFPHQTGWVAKARLYFDFTQGTCNVVPMALAPSLPLSNTYPDGSPSAIVYSTLVATIGQSGSPTDEELKDGLGRATAFCDSLLILDEVMSSLDGLVQRDSLALFSVEDFAMQFGPSAVSAYLASEPIVGAALPKDVVTQCMTARLVPALQAERSLISDERVVGRAVQRAKENWQIELVFDALLQDLASAVGADDPTQYSLTSPYSAAEIKAEPYKRLRVGFTYNEIVEFMGAHCTSSIALRGPSVELAVSALIDWFVDVGAVVPTISLSGAPCTRVYRKGESNPKWDEEFARFQLALSGLPTEDLAYLRDKGRTRLSKIAAIVSMAGSVQTGIRAGAFERGTVAMLRRSVVEHSDAELTVLARRLGFWGKSATERSA